MENSGQFWAEQARELRIATVGQGRWEDTADEYVAEGETEI